MVFSDTTLRDLLVDSRPPMPTPSAILYPLSPRLQQAPGGQRDRDHQGHQGAHRGDQEGGGKRAVEVNPGMTRLSLRCARLAPRPFYSTTPWPLPRLVWPLNVSHSNSNWIPFFSRRQPGGGGGELKWVKNLLGKNWTEFCPTFFLGFKRWSKIFTTNLRQEKRAKIFPQGFALKPNVFVGFFTEYACFRDCFPQLVVFSRFVVWLAFIIFSFSFGLCFCFCFPSRNVMENKTKTP